MIVSRTNAPLIVEGRHHSTNKAVSIPDDRVSLAETERSVHDKAFRCDACPDCSDTCAQDYCEVCSAEMTQNEESPACVDVPCNRKSSVAVYTMCQVRRHNTSESAWIVAGNDIYDITSYVNAHPGGPASLLKRAGGQKDCTEDLNFHSKRGKAAWEQFKIGRVVECGTVGRRSKPKSTPWWMYWNQ